MPNEEYLNEVNHLLYGRAVTDPILAVECQDGKTETFLVADEIIPEEKFEKCSNLVNLMLGTKGASAQSI